MSGINVLNFVGLVLTYNRGIVDYGSMIERPNESVTDQMAEPVKLSFLVHLPL